MAPLRILHVFRAPLGGLFRHVLDVARGQIAAGHLVGIFCDSSTGGARADKTLTALAPDLALGLHRMPMHRSIHPLDAVAVTRLSALARRLAPDVLHGHGSKGGAFARLAAGSGRAIRAYTPHGGSFNYHPGTLAHRLYMAAEKILERRTDVFLFESRYVRDRFEAFVGATDRLVRVVHNGIAEEEFEPIERAPDPFDLVYIGEFRIAKGVDTLIEALSLIKKKHGRRLTLLAVGSGPTETRLQDHARAAGVWDSTAFVPPQPIRAALARGRVMVVPSKAESLPYVILEAAAAAQPLVSTDVGGIPEIFGPYAGDLIPPSDPVRLAGKIMDALGQSEEARHAKALALSREVHDGFRIDTMLDGVLGGYADARAARRDRDAADPLSLPKGSAP